MDTLLYLVTRACMAVVALICLDTLAGTTHAVQPVSITAAAGLIIIADVIAYSNNGTSP